MVPFPSEYSTYTSVPGPQAPFGAPAPAEPTGGSSHFDDMLQNLATPAANKAGVSSGASAEQTAAPAATNPAPAGVPLPAAANAVDEDGTAPAGTAASPRAGANSTPKNNAAPVKAGGWSPNDATNVSTSSSAATALVTPPVTVLTPRPRLTWPSAPNAATDQKSPQPQDGNVPAAGIAAATVAATLASTISARAQVAAQSQPANAKSKSQPPNQTAANAVANAVAAASADSTPVPTPAAKSSGAADTSATPAPPADSNDSSASAAILAAMSAVAPTPLPQPLPVPAAGAKTQQAADETGISTAIDAPAVQAKAMTQNRQSFATRAQLGTAAALPQTAGAPSFDLDDTTENAAPAAATATADAALASTLRLAASAAAAGQASASTATATNNSTPGQVPPPALYTAQVANATVISSTAAKATTTSTPVPVASAAPSTSAATRPELTVAVPDLVTSAGFARALAPIQIETPASLPADVDASAVMSQIVQAMRVQLVQGGGTAQVTLQPGYLGGVTLNVKVDQDGVTASVVADTPAVREALRTQEPALRDALTSQGLRLDQFDVAAPGETPRKNSGGGQGSAAQDQRQPRQQKRRDPSEPAFEFVA